MNTHKALERRLPIGTELCGTTAFTRVWAPKCSSVNFVLYSNKKGGESRVQSLLAEPGGYFSAVIEGVFVGDRYEFQLDQSSKNYPDPASRFQPQGPHGPSQIVDPTTFAWTDKKWNGLEPQGQVIYEMHIGTFTKEGTYEAARRELGELKRLGITVLELMPIADFQGQFGWGYDGVNLYAPSHLYGTPDDLRGFIDEAHGAGLGVILDVVYNHFGADGNYIGMYSSDYFAKEYNCEWGEALNFDGPNCGPVREFFITNAGYWIDEFHFDGLRLDATQQIYDRSEKNVIDEIARQARFAAKDRSIIVVGENEPQDTRLITEHSKGGSNLDALWNDDFHHTARVAMTGKSEGYYADYRGTPQELISAIKHGFVYQGQHSLCRKASHGRASLHLQPSQLINFIQNHDQIANSGRGWRMDKMTTMGRYKAMMTLLLLGPNTPMLFQGQEFLSSAPFTYFAHHESNLAEAVAKGRRESLTKFRSMNNDSMLDSLPLPHDLENFSSCKLDMSERAKNSGFYKMVERLLELRRVDPVFSKPAVGSVDGAVLAPEAFVLRFSGEAGERLILINLGPDMQLSPCPEPLLANPAGQSWQQVFSSEMPEFNGCGAPSVCDFGDEYLPAHSATVLSTYTPRGLS